MAEPEGTMNGTTAEAEWTAVDKREPGDTAELKYYFKATAPRVKTVKSSELPVLTAQT